MSENNNIENISNKEIIIKDREEQEKLKNDPDKVFTYERAKFNGFGIYEKYDINDRVNELMELCKKQYPNLDFYLLWILTVDYILKEELKVETTSEEQAKKWYDEYLNERNKREYQNVQLLDENNKPIIEVK
jgi:hypothetical protein